MKIAIRSDWCKGCEICVRFCPTGTLEIGDDSVARAAYPDRCTGCELCERLCPDLAIELIREAADA